MNTEANKKIVVHFFHCFSTANVSEALELLDAKAMWHAMGREGGLPMSGEMDKDAIGELMGNVKAAIPNGLKLTPIAWTAEGDRVALEMESYGEMINGNVYQNRYHFLITVVDNKIISLREYMDTYHVKRCFIDG